MLESSVFFNFTSGWAPSGLSFFILAIYHRREIIKNTIKHALVEGKLWKKVWLINAPLQLSVRWIICVPHFVCALEFCDAFDACVCFGPTQDEVKCKCCSDLSSGFCWGICAILRVNALVLCVDFDVNVSWTCSEGVKFTDVKFKKQTKIIRAFGGFSIKNV